jgi:hypothetical protein
VINKSPSNKKLSGGNSPRNVLSRPQSGRELKRNNIVINNNINNLKGKVIEKINYERNPQNINRIYDSKNIKPNYHFKPNNQIVISNNNKAGYLEAIKIMGNNKPYVNNGPKIVITNERNYKR